MLPSVRAARRSCCAGFCMLCSGWQPLIRLTCSSTLCRRPWRLASLMWPCCSTASWQQCHPPESTPQTPMPHTLQGLTCRSSRCRRPQRRSSVSSKMQPRDDSMVLQAAPATQLTHVATLPNGQPAQAGPQEQQQGDEWEIAYEDIELGRRVGIGSFGEVYRGSWQMTDVAVKRLLDQEMSECRMAVRPCLAEHGS